MFDIKQHSKNQSLVTQEQTHVLTTRHYWIALDM